MTRKDHHMIPVWMSLDPETSRVTVQTQEFGDGDFPRGLRGQGWSIRQGEIDTDTWKALLNGSLPTEEQDNIHRTLWTQNGATAWPNP